MKKYNKVASVLLAVLMLITAAFPAAMTWEPLTIAS